MRPHKEGLVWEKVWWRSMGFSDGQNKRISEVEGRQDIKSSGYEIS